MGADVGNGHVHTRGDFLLRHTRSGKTRAHRVHVFAHLHDMPVGIEKAHDSKVENILPRKAAPSPSGEFSL